MLASSSWHWMDPVPTLHEVGRVLVPRRRAGSLWSGPDPKAPFSLRPGPALPERSEARDVPARTGASERPQESPRGSHHGRRGPSDFDPRDPSWDSVRTTRHEVFRWDLALDADDLIGLLGTFSWIITMPDETRRGGVRRSSRLLSQLLWCRGEVTVDVAFRCDAWRSRRHP